MTVLFWLCIGIFIQAYVGYPLTLLILRPFLRQQWKSRSAGPVKPPNVSLLISAYNEEVVIREKIENSLSLDYPEGRLRVIVISDGSTDCTEAIALEYADCGIEVRAFEERQGKVACLNRVIPTLESEIVVMSDSNSMYERDSIRRLVDHFSDPEIGCVCGRLRYVNPRKLAAGEGERLYWGYEGWIKRLESSLGSLLGANGAIYAYRRRLFRAVDPLMFCDDVIPVRIAIEGFLTIYDPSASCSEEASGEQVERRRRRRHASFGLRSMAALLLEAMGAGRLLVAYQCICHRILRWGGALALCGILVSSLYLPAPWSHILLAGQGLFYLAALAGYLFRRAGLVFPPVYFPYYFVVIHMAGLVGLWALLRRSDRPYWEPRQ
jgi:cellulose synthase/poly-beta-1,6-N-acetylglucosamine synthase-like glycosyltransferase